MKVSVTVFEVSTFHAKPVMFRRVMLGDNKTDAGPELISWSKQQHLTELWKKSVRNTDNGSLL